MSIRRSIVRYALTLVISLGVGWWLFADTFGIGFPTSGLDRLDQQGGLPGRSHIEHPVIEHTLRFAHFGGYEDYRLWRQVIADFTRLHPGAEVTQEYIVGLAGGYNTKMRQQVLSHTLPDVALIQLGPFHELAEHFADLSDVAKESAEGGEPLIATLDATGLAAFRTGGRQRGLPVSGGNLLIYGNAECFERADRFHGQAVPRPRDDWTIEEFRKTAELLTCDFDGDGLIDQFGFWLPRWIYYLPFIWSFGAELTDEAFTRWRLVGPEAERAFTFYRDLAVGDRVCPRDDEVPQLFQDVGFLTGRVALCVNGPWFMPFLAQTGLADSYFVAPIPKGKAGRVTRITWDGVVMPKDLPPGRRAFASQFIAFLLSKRVQNRIATTGRALPARSDSTVAFVDAVGNTERRRFVEALAYSRLQPLLPRFGEIDRAINKHLRHFLAPDGKLTAGAMLDGLARDPAVRTAFAGPGTVPR